MDSEDQNAHDDRKKAMDLSAERLVGAVLVGAADGDEDHKGGAQGGHLQKSYQKVHVARPVLAPSTSISMTRTPEHHPTNEGNLFIWFGNAYKLISENFGSFFVYWLVMYLIVVAFEVMIALEVYFFEKHLSSELLKIMVFVNATVFMLFYSISRILFRAGLYRFTFCELRRRENDGPSVQLNEFFYPFFNGGWLMVSLVMITFLSYVAVAVGFMFCLLPGWYLTVVLQYAIPLMVEHHRSYRRNDEACCGSCHVIGKSFSMANRRFCDVMLLTIVSFLMILPLLVTPALNRFSKDPSTKFSIVMAAVDILVLPLLRILVETFTACALAMSYRDVVGLSDPDFSDDEDDLELIRN